MMWSYVQFPDETQIAYSDVREDGTVRIDIERPRDWGFDSARCIMPAYQWSDVDGFSDREIEEFDVFLRNNAPSYSSWPRAHSRRGERLADGKPVRILPAEVTRAIASDMGGAPTALQLFRVGNWLYHP